MEKHLENHGNMPHCAHHDCPFLPSHEVRVAEYLGHFSWIFSWRLYCPDHLPANLDCLPHREIDPIADVLEVRDVLDSDFLSPSISPVV